MNPSVPPSSSLAFLQGDPAAVPPQSPLQGSDDVLPQALADELLRLDGVDGAWIERDEQGLRFVALHYSRPGRPSHLPSTVHGLPVRIVGGEPIRAGG